LEYRTSMEKHFGQRTCSLAVFFFMGPSRSLASPWLLRQRDSAIAGAREN
jgi:hypothetical protein